MKSVKKMWKTVTKFLLIEDITDWYYDFKQGVENLWIWFPVIWKDRWWDSYYIYALLHKKIELMEKNFRERGHHVGNVKDADRMKTCRILIKRIMDDDYSAMDAHDKKWGKPDFIWNDIEDQPGYCTLDISHKNVKTPEDEIQEKKDFKHAIDLEEYQKNQDINYLFHLMKKYSRTWWD